MKILSIIIFFLLFSFIGWYIEYINEVMLCKNTEPNYSIIFFKNKGKVPLLPIYAGGIFILYYITYKFFNTESFNRKHIIKQILFVGFIVMFLLSAFELIVGVLAEKITGKRLWDYRDNPMNIMGYVDILHSTAWFILGIVCVFFIKWSGLTI